MGNAQNDAQAYRDGYPDHPPDPPLTEMRANLDFHLNIIPSVPDGALLEDIHAHWWDDHDKLERHHGYIQWIFPIREHGMNDRAQPLTVHEASEIRSSEEAKARVLQSFRMMLGFYGMTLKRDGGNYAFGRTSDFSRRYGHLNRSFHNYLRITRIIKSLGELGFDDLQHQWVWFLVKEVFEHRQLGNAIQSLCDYWIPVVRDDEERAKLEAYLKNALRLSGNGNSR